jgi:hypothetical protein
MSAKRKTRCSSNQPTEGRRTSAANTSPRPEKTFAGRNGGTLVAGGGCAGTPGPGRPPSKIREKAALAFEASIEFLDRLWRDEKAKARDRLAAIELLGRYSIGVGSAQLDERMRAANQPREVRFTFVESPKVKR